MDYTKGRWEVRDNSAGGLVMAGLFPYAVGCKEGTIAKVTIEANALLIASAPDLYEALKKIIKSGVVYQGQGFDDAFEALTKAEGKPDSQDEQELDERRLALLSK